MRNIRELIPNQAALEAEQLEVAQAQALEAVMNAPVLSLEEESIEAGDQAHQAADILTDVNDTNRVVELTDALEDLAAIAETIEVATPAETQLIETNGQVAVAGTDVAPDEIIPAMESFVGSKISLEAIADMRAKAKQIWARILEFVKKIWTKITEFVHRIIGTIPRLRRAIVELEGKIEKIGDKKADGDLDITSNVAALSVDFAPIKGEGELRQAIANLAAANAYVFGEIADVTLARGKVVESVIKEFDPAKAGEAVAALRKALDANKAHSGPGMGTANKTRFPGYDTYEGQSLLGNVSLAHRQWTENKEASDLGALDRRRNSGFDLIASNEKGAMKQGAAIKMAPMTISEMKETLKSLSGVLDTLEKYDRGGKAKAIQQQAKDIESASSAAEKKLSGFKASSNTDEKNSVVSYRALLNFNAAYASWAAKPAVPMMTHSLKTIRSVLVVVQKSISAYGETTAPAAATK